jgi:hypothetical protein
MKQIDSSIEKQAAEKKNDQYELKKWRCIPLSKTSKQSSVVSSPVPQKEAVPRAGLHKTPVVNR